MKYLINALLLVLLITFSPSCQSDPQTPELVKVKFGMLPYADHSFAIIGIKNNWFKEVGIELIYKEVEVEHIIPYLQNGELDVCSTPPGILIASWDTANDLASFVFSDLFVGYALMAQPHKYRSYEELTKYYDPADAVERAIKQISGKRFAYPPETAIKPFIDLILKKGKITNSDFTAVVMEDPLTVKAMELDNVDFQVGGAPSRLRLEKNGYQVIVTSKDLLETAKPTRESPEIRGVLQNGWATRKTYYKEYKDIILKMAAVNYRIIDYINNANTTKSAAEIHMAYLGKLKGEKYDYKDAKVFYHDLDPFWSFDQQKEWFGNKESPLYYLYVNGAIIDDWDAKDRFKKEKPDVDDVIYADDVYRELLKKKEVCLENLKKVRKHVDDPEVIKNIERLINDYNFWAANDEIKRYIK